MIRFSIAKVLGSGKQSVFSFYDEFARYGKTAIDDRLPILFYSPGSFTIVTPSNLESIISGYVLFDPIS